MTIKITGNTNSPIPIKTPPKTGAEGGKKVADINAVKDDSVALTATTQEIKKTLGSSSALPVNIEKVNAIKKALAEGSYSINAEKVAKKFIELEHLLSRENST